jgi:hypothetical protein
MEVELSNINLKGFIGYTECFDGTLENAYKTWNEIVNIL